MTQADFYTDITNTIINHLERVEAGGYQAPFASLAAQGLPLNPISHNSYQGINIPTLWLAQQDRRFRSSHWATYKQWAQLGAQVKKGERGSKIIFFKTWEKKEENEQGEQENVRIPMARFYTVFNADQVEGYTHAEIAPPNETDRVQRLEQVEAFCTNTCADIRNEDGFAYYNHGQDFINMPQSIQFMDTPHASATENYYSILLHELTHWTGAGKRLARSDAQGLENKAAYAFEELIAELGAAFLCAKLGITQTPRENHAHYIKHWLDALKNEKRHIFKAAAKAAQAVTYLEGFQDGEAE